MDAFDSKNPLSIYEYSGKLVGHSLRSLFGDIVTRHKRDGKGGLGQMVEELFFGYGINSKREADFADAEVELKCTPVTRAKIGDAYRIKERLVCTMIDYFEIVDTPFGKSHLLSKCRLMLLLFYLYRRDCKFYDYEFVFRVLWQLPEKDLLLIARDYDTIARKVRDGQAHLLSEGDTMYLGACRKGQKGDNLQPQPNSAIKAPKRAFSLKPSYMRYVLSHVTDSPTGSFSNYTAPAGADFELVTPDELKHESFEDIILNRFRPYIGKDYVEICGMLGINAYQAKSKYADVCGLIASNGTDKRISRAEEFIKSGISMKTVRLKENGMPKEAMSFKNIDYQEIYDNDDWFESETYELFTSRFLFVVFKPVAGKTICVHNNRTGKDATEQAYVLDRVFFWTMPADDLAVARQYWENIRVNVLANHIALGRFWSLKDHRLFHVRPKAANASDKVANPHGGECDKYCYWFNADYVKRIIESQQNV